AERQRQTFSSSRLLRFPAQRQKREPKRVLTSGGSRRTAAISRLGDSKACRLGKIHAHSVWPRTVSGRPDVSSRREPGELFETGGFERCTRQAFRRRQAPARYSRFPKLRNERRRDGLRDARSC